MICVIGMGPGAIRYLTMEAVEKIKACPKVIAFGRISQHAKDLKSDIITVHRVSELIEQIGDGQDTAILASGDPCFYGILEYLKKQNIEVHEVVPGISSFQYMMAKLRKSWHNTQLISLHGREEGLETVMASRASVILTDDQYTPDFLSNLLYEKGLRGRIYAGFNLSYEDEKIVIKNIGEHVPHHSSLAVVMIENEMDQG